MGIVDNCYLVELQALQKISLELNSYLVGSRLHTNLLGIRKLIVIWPGPGFAVTQSGNYYLVGSRLHGNLNGYLVGSRFQ